MTDGRTAMRNTGVVLVVSVLAFYAVSVLAAWRQPVDPQRLEPRPCRYRVNVNDADVDTLCLLPGIGPNLAARIVSLRQARGPFTEKRQLLDVPGIGPTKQARLEQLIRVAAPADPPGATIPQSD